MIKRVNGRILSMAEHTGRKQLRARVLLEFRYEGGPRCSIVEGEVAMPAHAKFSGWAKRRLERRLLNRAWQKLESYFDGGESAEPNIFA